VLKFGSKKGPEVVRLLDEALKATQVTTGDLLYAGQRQRSRILQRTAAGTDVDGKPFAPYSSYGPIYYYPGAKSKNRKGAVSSIARKIGLAGRNSTMIKVAGSKHNYVQRTKKGLKFSNYAALKAAFGRANVDLRGLKAPHMLQAMIVRCGLTAISNAFGNAQLPKPLELASSADEVTIGIYGSEAERANAHQAGVDRMPRRKFVGANFNDQQLMINDIVNRLAYRMRQALGMKVGVE
jgi:hypothetical protein